MTERGWSLSSPRSGWGLPVLEGKDRLHPHAHGQSPRAYLGPHARGQSTCQPSQDAGPAGVSRRVSCGVTGVETGGPPGEVVPGESETLHGVMGTQFPSRGHQGTGREDLGPSGVTADR